MGNDERSRGEKQAGQTHAGDILDQLLKEAYGQDAAFREGQKEAIEAVLDGKRTLVVQKTGWGKAWSILWRQKFSGWSAGGSL